MSDDRLQKKLQRLEKWAEKVSSTWTKSLSEVDSDYLNEIRQMEEEKIGYANEKDREIEVLKAKIDQAGQDFAREKYRIEQQKTDDQEKLTQLQKDFDNQQNRISKDIQRVRDEILTQGLSYERQKRGLTDLYQEKKRQLLLLREKIMRQVVQGRQNLKSTKDKYQREIAAIKEDKGKEIKHLEAQLDSKKSGWATALERLRIEANLLDDEKKDVMKQLSNLKTEKEKELEDLRLQLAVARDQLEVDRVSLIEKAEADQKYCSEEVHRLEEESTRDELELQSLVIEKEKERALLEETFQKEETMLKETVSVEAERRDYEQKLFQQEKSIKEKELNRLREEYDKKKWHWENQIKTLMMQKSVQDAQMESEKLKTDREARVVLRSLESRRDELKRRLADIKARHSAFSANSQKELDLVNQRFHWRKDRLWSMWEKKLDVLKKERMLLGEQIETLESKFSNESSHLKETMEKQEREVQSLKDSLNQGREAEEAAKKQRNIQFELEKTRFIAQIKECETTILDWMDRQKKTHEDLAAEKAAANRDLSFLDQIYRREESELEEFLRMFQRALDGISKEANRFGARQNAA